MIINQIFLNNFRNYNKVNIKFNKNINIIIGDNAQGKTNILESIYFLSLTKSYRTNDDFFLIKQGSESCKITAKMKDEKVPKKVEIITYKNKKRLFINGNQIKKISDYIGIINVILMSPEDVEIIKGTPSDRRNLLNIELSKLSREYLKKLNEYNKLLKMRNDYLKLIMINHIADYRYLDIITDNIIDRAVYIYSERKKIIDVINNNICDIFENLTNIKNLIIKYKPNIDISEYSIENIKNVLKNTFYKNRQKEINFGITMYGPHRDDFEFDIGQNDIKYFGSQGQQKLAIISLKISLIKVFQQNINQTPILLLDDIFSELDRKKKNKLINYINEAGQVIITTNDIRDINKKKLKNTKVFEIKNNVIEEKGDI
ncbi:MAG: DNA replication/repair protein RecF [bacterium]|nr:DNA replication/repair protein RecF [bacterium]